MAKSKKTVVKSVKKSVGKKLKENEGYCVRCKTARKFSNPRIEKTEKGRRAKKGRCDQCNCKMNKFL